MAALAQLCCSPLSGHRRSISNTPHSHPFPHCSKVKFLNPNLEPQFRIPHAAGGGGGAGISSNGGGDGRGGGSNGGGDSFWDGFGPIGAFLKGWRERVVADPQFPFKVLMEELVGVSACIVGDMASRPNFGLNELDFVFSTMVVGSILNLLLMYILAPTSPSLSQALPSIFANSPTSHMFEPGSFSLMDRCGTFVYKGALFAAAGFAAGLVGTAISNGLIEARKRMDPEFETPNKPPPTLLNASAWAVQLGISSNLRYQGLNAVEFLLERRLPLRVFKALVVVLRCLNNVAGGMSFVAVARWMGSQVVEEKGRDEISSSSSSLYSSPPPLPTPNPIGALPPAKSKLWRSESAQHTTSYEFRSGLDDLPSSSRRAFLFLLNLVIRFDATIEEGEGRNALELVRSVSEKHLDLLRPSARYYSIFKGQAADAAEREKGKYTLIRDEEDSQLGLYEKPLPCFGCGIGWFSFLVGFLCPLTWYYATILYFGNFYRKDPRERAGLAASAISALGCSIILLIVLLILLF